MTIAITFWVSALYLHPLPRAQCELHFELTGLGFSSTSVSTAGQLRCAGCQVVPSQGAGANHVTVSPGSATPAKINEQFTVQASPAKPQ